MGIFTRILINIVVSVATKGVTSIKWKDVRNTYKAGANWICKSLGYKEPYKVEEKRKPTDAEKQQLKAFKSAVAKMTPEERRKLFLEIAARVKEEEEEEKEVKNAEQTD